MRRLHGALAVINSCKHCQTPISDPAAPAGYCCVGCATVAALLNERGLERYYAFQNGPTAPVSVPGRSRDLAWLDGPLAEARTCAGTCGLAQLTFDVQGIRCSACVWLLEQLFRRQQHAVAARVDPGVGRVQLTFRPECDVAAYVREVERFGYLAGPRLKADDDASDGTLWRLGLCAALTMNAMVFTAAFYFGLAPRDGSLFPLMRTLNMLLSAAVVVVGGGEFFSRAWAGLRRGLVTFELPIALGLALSFAGSLLISWRNPATFAFFDTVDTFTTLMLVGRWLQQRVLVQNRRRLLADDGIAGLYARRVEGGRVETAPAAKVQAGDALLVPAGDLVVTRARLVEDEASFSLDWINGEAVPRAFARGELVPAGAFNASGRAVRLDAEQPFAASALLDLLSPHAEQDPTGTAYGALLASVSRVYVPAVLTLASAAFALWFPHGLEPALHAATAVLVVTCPCALGLAIPLAYQLTAVELRRRGLFVVRESFLDRAARVRRLAFDKTGTLTLGSLRLANPAALDALPPADRALLYNLASRSAHPRSQCVQAALPASAAQFDEALRVREHAGQGMELVGTDGAVRARLGKPSWLGGQAGRDDDLWFEVAGEVRARLEIEEHLRSDAREELSALRAAGYGLAILSGDAPARVARVARTLGIDEERAVGGLSPEGKAGWLRQHGGAADTLLVGDGINDALGMQQALACGTPAIDRPTLAARADFYFLTSGISCVRTALEAAHRLRATTRVILIFALVYNVGALAASMLGLVGPLGAALAMPASSIFILLYTVRATRLAQPVASLSHPAAAFTPAQARA